MTAASDNKFPKVIITEGVAPSSPSSGDQKVYIDSTSHHLSRKNSSGTVVDLETNQSSSGVNGIGTLRNNSGAYTTSSTSFVDIDGTNLSLTLVTGAHRCIVGFSGMSAPVSTSVGLRFCVTVDGTAVGGTGGEKYYEAIGSNGYAPVCFTQVTAALTAASHTFKVQWKTASGTASLYSNSSDWEPSFWVIELPT